MRKLLTVFAMAACLAPAQLTFTRRDAAANGAIGLIAADFNRDGRADIAEVTVSGTVAVLIGRGDGTFEPSRDIIRDPLPARFVIAADVNADGRMDLISTHQLAHVVSVTLGRGDGTFGPAVTFPCGNAPNGLVATDVNGDGKMDIAVANNAGLLPSQAGKTVTVILGKGDGTFGSPISSAVLGERPYKVSAGDFNRDGKADLVVVNSGSPDASILISRGDGTFEAPRPIPGLNIGSDAEVADFDHDGRADIAVLAPPRVVVLLGNGDGLFGPPISTAFDGLQMVPCDLNGDGIADLAGASPPFSVAIALIGRGDGTFEDQQPFQVATLPTEIAVADFNGDGVQDMVTSHQSSGLTVLLNNTPRPAISPNGIVNGASFLAGPVTVAPGEIVTIFGSNLGPAQLVTARLRTPEFLDTMLEKTRVLVDGVEAPLIFVRQDQLSAVIPYEVAGRSGAQLQVVNGVMRSIPLPLRVTAALPGIFTADASGTGQAAALNQNGTLNSASNPAAKGSIIAFFATGEGATNPAGVSGKLAAVPLPQPVQPLIVGIANMGAEILYAGASPGLVSGLMQINVRVPPGAPAGAQVPLVIKVGEALSQPGVTVAIQ